MTDLFAAGCPDCRTRGHVYSIGACLRCNARHIARLPFSIAVHAGEAMRRKLSTEDHADLLRMVREEREADREIA